MKDWRTKGDYVLVLLQRPGDSSLVNLIKKHGSYEGFVTHTLNEIKQNTDRPIKVRMHPSRIDRQRAILKNYDVQVSENLQGAGLLSVVQDYKQTSTMLGVLWDLIVMD